ncbi:Uma2 family endonuclease [Nodosilinea sp. LEGE 07088]|uniref:Uma2 family endonuclease n=1 Tax=Nodosilinea sp. LEGE 07088 TaxID=2777968 RepID=UPI001881C53A|nr:Uma2 family endonuclease [Nodosilinea sp. LEGE 07088]MBE9140123.1 Uma2 family endonuclease [Nodosilinea sp. LEGE 07088]
MTALWPQATTTYPSSDGEPVAETYAHFYALLITLEVLRQYLAGRQATVLANQFMYYAQGFPKLRVAPDVMVIFEVEPGGRDNYKIWEEGQVPSAIFEMTSAGTRQQDEVEKKTLYEGLGVQEYWLFDPKGEWIAEQLKGYRLRDEVYIPIEDSCSEPLGLRLQIDGGLIAFYRQDTGEKLLIPDELAAALRQEALLRQQAEQRAAAAERRASAAEQALEAFKAQLRDRGIDPETLLN